MVVRGQGDVASAQTCATPPAGQAGRETAWTRPSFGNELFLGNFRLELIHPQPELDAAAVQKGETFLGRLRAFLTEHVDRQQIEREARIPESVVQGLRGSGALGMKIPEEYGGLGLSQVYYNRALAMAGTWHSSISTLLSAHQSIGLPEPLRLFGSEEQKRHWLPRLARDHISAFLLTEPNVGSDPAGHGPMMPMHSPSAVEQAGASPAPVEATAAR